MFEDLLKVGQESNADYTHSDGGELPGEIITGAVEALRIGIEADAASLDKIIQSSYAIEDSIERDKQYIAAGKATSEVANSSMSEFRNIVSVGLGSEIGPVVGAESIANNPSSALRVGVEAKEGVIRKLIRNTLLFLDKIIEKIKEYKDKIIVSVKTLLMSAKRLQDKVDEVEDSASLQVSKEEDKGLHDKIVKYLGGYLSVNSGKIVDSLEQALDEVEENYREAYDLTDGDRSNKIWEAIFKNGTVAGIKLLAAIDNATTLSVLKRRFKDVVPISSDVRELINKDDIIEVVTISRPRKYTVHVLYADPNVKNELKLISKKASVKVKTSDISINDTITGTELKKITGDTVKAIDAFSPRDVVEAAHKRAYDARKDMSDATSTSKRKKKIRPAKKYISFIATSSIASCSASVDNLSAAYDTCRKLVANI
jgi:hypothetical protein